MLRVGDLVKIPDEDCDGEVLSYGVVVEAEDKREAYHQHVRVYWGGVMGYGTLWHLSRNLEVVNEGR